MRVYDARAAEYADALGADPASNAALSAFIAALPKGGRVLDLGCGPGTWARRMVEAGLTVEGWDASEGMIAIASRVPGLTVRQARFEDLDAEAAYDGIWANFSLLHAPRADMPEHLARIARALRPGGVLHVGLKEGTGEARDSLGRFYAYYGLDEFRDLLRDAGLRPDGARQGADKGLDGTVAPWFTLSATKQPSSSAAAGQ
nr:class I SAM-dependent methyltransferase [Thetidibacter halocola]